jgi:hypothetical protein
LVIEVLWRLLRAFGGKQAVAERELLNTVVYEGETQRLSTGGGSLPHLRGSIAPTRGPISDYNSRE